MTVLLVSQMTDPYRCPLCPATHDDRTDLHVHLEVSHRKSEIVSYLVDVGLAERRLEGPSRFDEQSVPPSV